MPITRNYGNIEAGEVKVKKPTKRKRNSIFFLTWNSNKPVTDINNPQFQEMETKAMEYFNKLIDNAIDYIIIKKEGDNADKIISVATDGAFEIGSEQRRFHAHIYIKVGHYSLLRIDIDKIRNEVNEILPGRYINVIASDDTVSNIADYIHKYNYGQFPRKIKNG